MKTENLPLVKAIRACDKLSPQKKTAVIKKIDRIFKSKEERTECDFVGENPSLWQAFVWSCTKEGHSYWEEIAIAIEE